VSKVFTVLGHRFLIWRADEEMDGEARKVKGGEEVFYRL
jgi:hypothetical protein